MGDCVGLSVGEAVGDCVGAVVGDAVGDCVGAVVGDTVGDCVGLVVGDVVGLDVGSDEGHRDPDVGGPVVGAAVVLQPQLCPVQPDAH